MRLLILAGVLVDPADRDVAVEVVGIEIERAAVGLDRLLVVADVLARLAEELEPSTSSFSFSISAVSARLAGSHCARRLYASPSGRSSSGSFGVSFSARSRHSTAGSHFSTATQALPPLAGASGCSGASCSSSSFVTAWNASAATSVSSTFVAASPSTHWQSACSGLMATASARTVDRLLHLAVLEVRAPEPVAGAEVIGLLRRAVSYSLIAFGRSPSLWYADASW